ncbi:hypothetical protein N799_05700 [Lysobacter arseniciresistens ZS79]|uniref:EF-hand domain-containing protein n=1 Tax=Lysobacter arseniciresistens ZS79 TaxID=913325 RepID=A0A0A0F4U0_9GAMM|nr:EF-hand domain-containing protein [Lysobacter arseniciresistens]KGM57550.1 hypothetical protein N799_05700 [Lysobacter arseniciresistens ZS79]
MNTLTTLAAAATLCIASGAIHAQEARNEGLNSIPPGDVVESVTLDTTAGPVTVTSSPGIAPSAEYGVDFAALDRDDDGYLLRTEAAATTGRTAPPGDLSAQFDSVDEDNDDRLTFKEVLAWVY